MCKDDDNFMGNYLISSKGLTNEIKTEKEKLFELRINWDWDTNQIFFLNLVLKLQINFFTGDLKFTLKLSLNFF